MTVTVTNTLAGPFYPNGVTTAFPFTFKVASLSEIRVFTVLNGVEATVSPAAYSVSLGVPEGGTINFTSAPPVGVGQLFVEGSPSFGQGSAFSNVGFLPTTLNSGFDRSALRDLWLRARINRALMVPPGEAGLSLPSATARANKILGFGSDGAPLLSSTATFKGDPGNTGASAYQVAVASGFTGTQGEWLASLVGPSGSGGGKLDVVSSRAFLSVVNPVSTPVVFLQEDGREGFFEWVAGDQSARVALDPQQGVYVAPSTATSGVSGAWVRRFEGGVNVRWFGASPSATATVNTTAFKAALAYLAAGNNQYSWLTGTHALRLYIPAGKYLLNDVLNVHVTLTIEGDGPRSTHLKWAAGSSGFRILRVNTGEVTAPGATGSGGAADESIIRGMMLEGGVEFAPFTGGENFDTIGNEGNFHGIELRARASIYDVVIYQWQGDGIYSLATAGGGTVEGNANLLRVFNVTCWNCRNGIFLDGADTNACEFYAYNGFSNRQTGFYDSSFLSNVWTVHVDGNGFSELSVVHYSGRIYYVLFGQEAWCTANPPTGAATTNQGWAYLRDAGPGYGGAKTWVSGGPGGRPYRVGGAFICEGGNAFSLIQGYSESGQPPAQVGFPVEIKGGFYAGVNQLGTTVNYKGTWTPRGIGMAGMACGGDIQVTDNIFTGGNVEFTKDSPRQFTGPNVCAVYQSNGGMVILGSSTATNWGLTLGNGGNNALTFDTGGSTKADFWGDVNLRTAGKFYKSQGTQVVGPRRTGWASPTGTATRTAFATGTATVQDVAERLKALIDDLTAHGLIGA